MQITLRLVVVFVALVLGLSNAHSTVSTQVNGHEERATLRFAVPAFRPKQEMQLHWQPLADYLEQQIPSRRFVLQVVDIKELEHKIRNKEIDIVLTQPAHYVALSIEQNLYSPLATLVEYEMGQSLTSFGGVIVTRASNQHIKTFTDLKGRHVAASIKASLGGYQMQAYELLLNGIKPTDYQVTEVGQQQDLVIDAVLTGKVDAGFVRTGLLEELARDNKIKLADFRVLQSDMQTDYPLLISTRLYPQWALAAMPWVEAPLAKEVARAVLTMPAESEAAHAARISGFTIPGDYRSVEQLMRALRIPPFNKRVPLQIVWEDHRTLVIATLLILMSATLWAIVLLIRSRMRRKQAESQLRQSASVFQHANEGIVITDTAGTILDVNAAFSNITGYTREEVLGQNPRLLKSGRMSPEFYSAMWNTLKSTGRWSGEIWNRRKNGEHYPELLTISTVCDEYGREQRYVALFADISQFKRHEQQLEHIAHYDALTNLPNRVLLADRLQSAINQALRHQRQLAVAYLDLDGFKAVNDTYGHQVGDQLLIELAARMKDVLRTVDTLSRLGGDEFVIVLLDLESQDDAIPILERVLQACSQAVVIDGNILGVSASLGVSFFPQNDTINSDQLLRQADQAMYQAKLTGKNRYYLFDAEHDQALRERNELIEQIHNAIFNDEFILFYQPKVNMRTGEVIGAEALIRWQHPQRGLLAPSQFLPIIENHQLSIPLGEWVMTTAIAQIAEWRRAGLAIPVSINVDAMQLQQTDFIERLRSALAPHPEIEPGDLMLEILETSALEDIAWASELITRCQEIGVSFALDDFGTGYSSLTYLRRLPAHTLKIDQSFVRSMLDDAEDLAILDGIVALAESFQRQAIAEGVETELHCEMLLRLGCEFGQGYAIARPMPASNFLEWFTTRRPTTNHDYPTISRDKMPVLFAMVEHRAWVTALGHYLREHRNEPPQLNHDQCRFGKWLIGSGAELYGNNPILQQILPLHEAIHQKANHLTQLKQSGHNSEALTELSELEQLRDQLHTLLFKLIEE